MDLSVGNLVLFGDMSTWVRPLWTVLLAAGAAIGAFVAVWVVIELIAPKLAAIARTTAKEATAQPLFYVLLVIGILALLLFPFIPYNTFGEDVKMLKTEGLTLIKVLAIVLALWTASVSIAEEIEGRTALTVLSKPVGRWELILGKFLGIIIPVAILFLILGALFLSSVSFKVVYDARESALPEPSSIECQRELVSSMPGLALSFLEAVVMASISVAISTRLPMLPNLVICLSVYVLGHLVPMIIDSPVAKFEVVSFIGRLLGAVLPVLDHFNMEAPISAGKDVPLSYLAYATGYAALYSTVSMLVALFLFEDRDVA